MERRILTICVMVILTLTLFPSLDAEAFDGDYGDWVCQPYTVSGVTEIYGILEDTSGSDWILGYTGGAVLFNEIGTYLPFSGWTAYAVLSFGLDSTETHILVNFNDGTGGIKNCDWTSRTNCAQQPGTLGLDMAAISMYSPDDLMYYTRVVGGGIFACDTSTATWTCGITTDFPAGLATRGFTQLNDNWGIISVRYDDLPTGWDSCSVADWCLYVVYRDSSLDPWEHDGLFFDSGDGAKNPLGNNHRVTFSYESGSSTVGYECAECFIGSDCNDSVACTVDECTNHECTNTPDDGACLGDEYCDPTKDCTVIADDDDDTTPDDDDDTTPDDDDDDDVTPDDDDDVTPDDDDVTPDDDDVTPNDDDDATSDDDDDDDGGICG